MPGPLDHHVTLQHLGAALAVVQVTDGAPRVIYANDACSELTGFSVEALCAPNSTALLDATAIGSLRIALAEGTAWRGGGVAHRKDGGAVAVERVITPLAGGRDGAVLLLLPHGEGERDTVVGLQMKPAFAARLGTMIDEALGGRSPFPMVLNVDFDHFSRLMALLPDAQLTQYLVAHARRLMDVLPEAQISFAEPDRFLVAVCDAMLLEPIIQGLGEPVALDGNTYYATQTIGMAMYPIDGETPESLVRAAIIATADGKRAGGARLQPYQKDSASRIDRLRQIEAALHAPGAAERLHVEYQPIMAVDSGAFAGVEALLRWEDPTLGRVSPAEFIPVAENTPQIHTIGAWVLAQAVAETAALRALVPGATLAVNASPAQLSAAGRDHFLAALDAVLATGQIRPDQLIIEVTESLIGDAAVVTAAAEIKARGVRIAIDDFGCAYANFASLIDLKADYLKLDRSIITKIAADASAGIVAGGIVELGHALGMIVVAEGIETADDLAHVASFGCDRAQGWLLGRPQRIDALCRFVETRPQAA